MQFQHVTRFLKLLWGAGSWGQMHNWYLFILPLSATACWYMILLSIVDTCAFTHCHYSTHTYIYIDIILCIYNLYTHTSSNFHKGCVCWNYENITRVSGCPMIASMQPCWYHLKRSPPTEKEHKSQIFPSNPFGKIPNRLAKWIFPHNWQVITGTSSQCTCGTTQGAWRWDHPWHLAWLRLSLVECDHYEAPTKAPWIRSVC